MSTCSCASCVGLNEVRSTADAEDDASGSLGRFAFVTGVALGPAADAAAADAAAADAALEGPAAFALRFLAVEPDATAVAACHI